MFSVLWLDTWVAMSPAVPTDSHPSTQGMERKTSANLRPKRSIMYAPNRQPAGVANEAMLAEEKDETHGSRPECIGKCAPKVCRRGKMTYFVFETQTQNFGTCRDLAKKRAAFLTRVMNYGATGPQTSSARVQKEKWVGERLNGEL
jgi:hypothetical protein